MRILYVEDNLANLALVQRLARIGNHEIITHADGETALARFQQDNPDLVLMDIQLKGVLNGLDVVKKLREQGHKTPIIALTAYAMVGDRERCLEAGCNEYLPKPLPVEQLVEFFQRYDPKVAAPAVARVSSTSDLPALEGGRANGHGAITVNLPPTENAAGAANVGQATPAVPAATPAPVANGNSNPLTPEAKPDVATEPDAVQSSQPAPNSPDAPIVVGNSGEPKLDNTSQVPKTDDTDPLTSPPDAEPPKAASSEQPAAGPNTPSV